MLSFEHTNGFISQRVCVTVLQVIFEHTVGFEQDYFFTSSILRIGKMQGGEPSPMGGDSGRDRNQREPPKEDGGADKHAVDRDDPADSRHFVSGNLGGKKRKSARRADGAPPVSSKAAGKGVSSGLFNDDFIYSDDFVSMWPDHLEIPHIVAKGDAGSVYGLASDSKASFNEATLRAIVGAMSKMQMDERSRFYYDKKEHRFRRGSEMWAPSRPRTLRATQVGSRISRSSRQSASRRVLNVQEVPWTRPLTRV